MALKLATNFCTEHLDLVSVELLLVEVSLGVEGVGSSLYLMVEDSDEVMIEISQGDEGGASVE